MTTDQVIEQLLNKFKVSLCMHSSNSKSDDTRPKSIMSGLIYKATLCQHAFIKKRMVSPVNPTLNPFNLRSYR